jgi:hypothetical protein
MPIARVQLEDGRIARFEVPEGTTPEAVEQYAAQLSSSGVQSDDGQGDAAPNQESPGNRGFFRDLSRAILGGAEVGANIASSALAGPAAGISGLVHAAIPGGPTGPEAIEAVRNAATYTPRTEKGQQYAQSVGNTLEPVANAIASVEDSLGDAVFKRTESPTLAAAAKSFPTFIAEMVGVGIGSKAIRGVKASKASRRADNLLQDAAPSREHLREISNGLFKEVDEMGVSVDPNRYRGLANDLLKDARASGLDKMNTPAAHRIIDRMEEAIQDGNFTFSELSALRETASGVASMLNDPHQAKLGMMALDKIDEFMGSSGIIAADASKSVGAQVGARLRTARELWGRMRRSEMLEEAMYNASLQATGFENGIRTQFRAILRDKKKRRYFRADELREMERVVRGTKASNLMKLLGKFGFSEGQATNYLGGMVGGGAGAYVGGALGGPAGAFMGSLSVSGGGTLARSAAQRMTARNARLADALVRSGKGARETAKEYLRNAKNPDPNELAEILLKTGADVVDDAPLDEFTRKALEIAARRRADAAAGASVASVERGERR